MSKYIKWPNINIIYIMISIITIGCILIFPAPLKYNHLYILPFVFMLGALFTVNLYIFPMKHIVQQIINLGYFIRMVITPLFICIGNYNSFFRVIIPNEYIFSSIISICYEYIIVMAICYIFRKKTIDEPSSIRISRYNNSKTVFIILILLIFMIFAFNFVPEIKDIYPPFYKSTLMSASDLRWDNETIVQRGSISRVVYSLFTFIWPIVRLLLPSLGISLIVKKMGLGTKSLILSSFMLLSPFLFISNDSIGPLLAVLISLIVLTRVYGKQAIPIIIIGIIISSIAFIAIVSSKIESWMLWRGDSGISVIGQMLNAYFPGLENTSLILMIENTKKLESIFFDLYYAIPFKETLFGFKGIYLQDLFVKTSATSAQIIPFTAQIGHYVTMVIAPFFTGYIAKVAICAEYKSKLTDDFWKMFLNISIAIFSAVAINMYSFSIYLHILVNLILPVAIITHFTKKRKI